MSTRQALSLPDDETLSVFEKSASAAPPGAVTFSATLRLISPALLGGFDPREPDALAPLRTKAARGQLRRFWCLLALAGDLDDCGLSDDSLRDQDKKVADLASKLWGALGDESKPAKSLVGVDLVADSWDIMAKQSYEFKPQPNGNWLVDKAFAGLEYGLHFASAPREGPLENRVPRTLCVDEQSFELRVVVMEHAYAKCIERTLLCWATFGGLGGRTSRGMGAVELQSLHRDDGRPCNAVHWGLREMSGAGRVWVVDTQAFKGALFMQGIDRPPPRQNAPPRNQLPSRFTSAYKALAWGLLELRNFTQGENFGRNRVRGMSHWPEARMIRHLARQHFRHIEDRDHHHDPVSRPSHLPGGDLNRPVLFAPRASLGHRAYRFVRDQAGRGDKMDPTQHTIVPEGSDRLPSSLIVRPVAVMVGGQKRFGCLLVQRSDMTEDRLPNLVLKQVEGQRDYRGRKLKAWNSGWRPGRGGPDGKVGRDCEAIYPLQRRDCISGIFDPPSDAAQVLINLAYNHVQGRGRP